MSHSPADYGFRFCSRCRTWVLRWRTDAADPVGLCPVVCADESYCKREQTNPREGG
jgi:hypothetical protein